MEDPKEERKGRDGRRAQEMAHDTGQKIGAPWSCRRKVRAEKKVRIPGKGPDRAQARDQKQAGKKRKGAFENSPQGWCLQGRGETAGPFDDGKNMPEGPGREDRTESRTSENSVRAARTADRNMPAGGFFHGARNPPEKLVAQDDRAGKVAAKDHFGPFA